MGIVTPTGSTASDAWGVLGAVHTVGNRSAVPARVARPDERASLFQLLLAAEVMLAILLLGLGSSAQFLAPRVPGLAVIGRAAPAMLVGAVYLIAAVLVSWLVLLAG